MFSLFQGYYKLYFEKPIYKILIVGLNDSGKTLKKLDGQKFSNFDRIQPTCGLNIGKFQSATSQNIFWDLGGQRLIRPIWKKYYSECHGIIFVIDSTKPLDEAKNCFFEALNNKDLNGVPLLILINKIDLDQEEANFAEILELDKLEREFNMQKCSGLKDINLQESINWLIQVINVLGKKNCSSSSEIY